MGDTKMTTELNYLTWITALTAFMWMPYILNSIKVRGLLNTVSYPEFPQPLASWATRMKAAHTNAVENLAVFATLVLIAHVASISNEATVTACAVYFWARLFHFIIYSMRIPWLRTFSFVAGFGAQVTLAWQILS
jgi:uncharacterized MAPEG superfamily protein